MPLLLLKKEPPTLSSPLGSAAHLCFLESALFLPLVNLLSLVVLLAVWFAFLFQLPHGTDENWLQKLYNNFVNKNSLFEKPRMSNTSFIIQHFADKVQWESGAELSARGCLAVPWDEQASQGLFRSELSQLACSCDEEYLCVCKRVCVCVCECVCEWRFSIWLYHMIHEFRLYFLKINVLPVDLISVLGLIVSSLTVYEFIFSMKLL